MSIYDTGNVVYILKANRIQQCTVQEVLKTGDGVTLKLRPSIPNDLIDHHQETHNQQSITVPIFNHIMVKQCNAYPDIPTLLAALVGQYEDDKNHYPSKVA